MGARYVSLHIPYFIYKISNKVKPEQRDYFCYKFEHKDKREGNS